MAAAALAAQWTLHAAVPGAPFAPFSFGDWLIRQAPGALATTAIDALGHQALRLLAAGVVVGALALGAAWGRRTASALAGVGFLSTLGAARLDPKRPSFELTLLAAVVAGGAALATAIAVRPPAAHSARPEATPDAGRRRVLAALALGLGAVGLGVATVRRVTRQVRAAVVRVDRRATRVDDPAYSGILGLSEAVTPRDRHYVVDIDLDDPVVVASAWRLRVGGAVARPRAFSLADLRALPIVERVATLACISNPVGGDLVGNARWAGVPLADLLQQAGPLPGATTLEARAADGYVETLPLSAALHPDVLVAIGMNGALLPRAHGFPARLRVPARYGVKNVKWLEELRVVRERRQGYWGERGWDDAALIHLQSRIDVPADRARAPRRFVLAGVAWAGDRRVSRVEVSADDGRTWMPAQLEREGDPLSWRRWRLPVCLQPGVHALTVRATDGSGRAQDKERRPPHPAGATGWHRIVVTVEPR